MVFSEIYKYFATLILFSKCIFFPSYLTTMIWVYFSIKISDYVHEYLYVSIIHFFQIPTEAIDYSYFVFSSRCVYLGTSRISFILTLGITLLILVNNSVYSKIPFHIHARLSQNGSFRFLGPVSPVHPISLIPRILMFNLLP